MQPQIIIVLCSLFILFFPFYCPLWCWKCVLISYIMYISISQINYAFSCWFSCCSCNLLIFDWYFRLALSKASLSVLKRRERIKKNCKKSRTLREVNCCDIHNKGRSSIHSVKYRLTYESDPFFPHDWASCSRIERKKNKVKKKMAPKTHTA